MRRDKIAVLLLTAALTALAVCWVVRELQTAPAELELTLRVQFGAETRRIACWADEDGAYYGFFPSGVELSQVTLLADPAAEVLLDGQTVRSEGDCAWMELERAYPLSYRSGLGRADTTLTLLRSENLPAMYIDTQSGGMYHVHRVKGNEEPGHMAVYSPEGQQEYNGILTSISGRGNTTWEHDKKPYNLTLEREADLLGMGAAQNWVLLANAYDSSNLRNKLVYDFAEQLGMAYSPECQWVDLYLNGEYAGLYLLCTRNEVHAQRVDISRIGSFLVSMELYERLEEQELPFVEAESSRMLAFRIHYTDMDSQSLRQMLRCMENAIMAADGIDPETGACYTDLIDLDSWAMRYLLDEVFGNYDGGSLSQFFYYDAASADGKVYAGPVWDMDNCMGRNGYAPCMIWAGRPTLWHDDDTPLFYALMEKEAFRQRVLELYEQVFAPALGELLEHTLEAYAGTIRESAKMNAVRWQIGEPEGQECALARYLEERMAFLEHYFFGNGLWHFVQVETMEHIWQCYAVPDGQSLNWCYEAYGLSTRLEPRYWSEEDQSFFETDSPILESKILRWEQPNNAEQEVSKTLLLKQAAPAVFAGGIFICLTILDRSRRKGRGRK